MSSLNRSNVIEFPSRGRVTPSHLADLTEEIQKGLNLPSVSPEFLETVKNYLHKIDVFLPKPAVRDPATDEFLWTKGDADKFLTIYETLGAISNHPDLGSYECDEGGSIIGAKAMRLMVTLMLYVPGLDDRIKKSNGSASNPQS